MHCPVQGGRSAGRTVIRKSQAALSNALRTGTVLRRMSLAGLAVVAPGQCDRPVTHVNVFARSCEPIPAGDTAQFYADANASTGWPGILYNSADRPGRFHWSSADPGLATVTFRGVVRGIVPGTVTISATAEGKTGSRDVVIVAGIRGIEVSPTSARIPVGDTVRLSAVVYDLNGAPLHGLWMTQTIEDKNVVWPVAFEQLAFVGRQAGKTTITICGANRDASVALTVVPRGSP